MSESPRPDPALQGWGWNPAWAAAWADLDLPERVPARVLRVERELAWVRAPQGEGPARLSRALRRQARDPRALPVVGDWVALAPGEGGGDGRLEAVLPRRGLFEREASGAGGQPQPVAANVDLALVVAGLDGELNVRRVERFLTAVAAAGATPLLLLNKADLAGDEPAREVAGGLVRRCPGLEVLVVSAAQERGLEPLRARLTPGATVALLGASGVGKSTLANALLGAHRQDTGPVRAHDRRGQHTTTRRELFPLPGGALLLDTPGLRELAPWDAEEALARAFAELEELARACRFRDCAHDREPGCALREAAEAGRLEPDRLASWLKLTREQAQQADRRTARGRHELRRHYRELGRARHRAAQQERRFFSD